MVTQPFRIAHVSLWFECCEFHKKCYIEKKAARLIPRVLQPASVYVISVLCVLSLYMYFVCFLLNQMN